MTVSNTRDPVTLLNIAFELTDRLLIVNISRLASSIFTVTTWSAFTFFIVCFLFDCHLTTIESTIVILPNPK